jgi:hypothetical protein
MQVADAPKDCEFCLEKGFTTRLALCKRDIAERLTELQTYMRDLDAILNRLRQEIFDRQAEIERLVDIGKGKVFELHMVEGQLAVLKELEDKPCPT